MAGIGSINLKVLLMDTDFFALQAIYSYLAWDRRTRVMRLTSSLDEMWRYIKSVHDTELPDVVVLGINHFADVEEFENTVINLRKTIKDVIVICLAEIINDPEYILAAARSGAASVMLKQEVGYHIAWAIVYALKHDFVITNGVAKASEQLFDDRISNATLLPEQRDYPELTERIRQAIYLYTVSGMSAGLAADEMGISLHTVRGYVKTGYRIMEDYDEHTEYPVGMTPQERAFMRFTALDIPPEEFDD